MCSTLLLTSFFYAVSGKQNSWDNAHSTERRGVYVFFEKIIKSLLLCTEHSKSAVRKALFWQSIKGVSPGLYSKSTIFRYVKRGCFF